MMGTTTDDRYVHHIRVGHMLVGHMVAANYGGNTMILHLQHVPLKFTCYAHDDTARMIAERLPGDCRDSVAITEKHIAVAKRVFTTEILQLSSQLVTQEIAFNTLADAIFNLPPSGVSLVSPNNV